MFIVDSTIFIHGGLEDEKHNNPASNLNELKLDELFEKDEVISGKLKKYLEDISKPKLEEGNKNVGNENNLSPNSSNSGKEIHFS